eukprot:GEMP01051995.1.p1 GENE.GEMP01051995.1~~GEMP01051995.1.p1  ORF type:complete len:230 (+),score=39.98 GEMP01051995.1:183-872(+)
MWDHLNYRPINALLDICSSARSITSRRATIATIRSPIIGICIFFCLVLCISSVHRTCDVNGLACGCSAFFLVVFSAAEAAYIYQRFLYGRPVINLPDNDIPLIAAARPSHGRKNYAYFARTMDEWMLHTWSASVSYNAKGPPQQCCICFEDLQKDEWIRILPCTHSYHHDCIAEWSISNQFRNNPVCPHCKYNIRDTPLDDEPARKVEEFIDNKYANAAAAAHCGGSGS